MDNCIGLAVSLKEMAVSIQYNLFGHRVERTAGLHQTCPSDHSESSRRSLTLG